MTSVPGKSPYTVLPDVPKKEQGALKTGIFREKESDTTCRELEARYAEIQIPQIPPELR